MQVIEKIAMGLIGLAIVVAIVASRSNSSKVADSVFTGSSNLFGSILKPVS